ncbi:unnamed protein product [Mycena citricolor]|uniref:F-box domain-containing protein n=1 Tax=Mycena citricolor TaxID=2018698 RepID=A0AAD2HSV0_9AGAR|nr:unnamed protein product [Mycena citricolor]
MYVLRRQESLNPRMKCVRAFMSADFSLSFIMPKRTLSPTPLLPPAKRQQIDANTLRPIALSFDDLFYEELILLVFSQLSWSELCAAEAVNKNWQRISLDNGLWREQYIRVFGRSRLRGGKGFAGRSDGREVRPLPGRAVKALDLKDWRWMFRISWNWKKGRCRTEHIEGVFKPPEPGSTPSLAPPHVVLTGSTTIIASSETSMCPEVHCLHTGGGPTSQQTLLCDSRGPRGPCSIAALALDQSAPRARLLQLAAFLSTGEFLVFAVDEQNPRATARKLTYIPQRPSSRTTAIIQAVFHYPLLISLSEAFTLSIYDLSADTVKHTQTLTTYTAFPPTSLVLSAQPGDRYKLVLTYAMPVFPVHFSIGATELIIASSHDPMASLTVISTRTARALDVPPGWIDQDKLRCLREQWSRKLLHIQDTQSDGKWIVVGPGESPPGNTVPGPVDSLTSLQMYRLSLPAASSVASPPPKLTFIRYLHHSAGAVSSMALADGRCVTLGKNGSIWVWDLESGAGAMVSSPSASIVERSTVVFDDRRIISARAGKLVIHRFDI